MNKSCYGFKSHPDEIEVTVSEIKYVHKDRKKAVKINDPEYDFEYALTPEKARRKAERIRENADSRKCLRLAEDIEKIADRVEEQQ